jgi:hypothetical protein
MGLDRHSFRVRQAGGFLSVRGPGLTDLPAGVPADRLAQRREAGKVIPIGGLRPRPRLWGLYLFCALLSGCSRVVSKNDIAGCYELGDGAQKISLEIKSDGTYSEIVMLRGAVVDHRSARWRWAPSFVDFDSLWIPKEFAPDYILRADAAAAPGEPKYTEPGHWSFGAESHFGSMVLVAFPDAGVNFKLMRCPMNRGFAGQE